jgi:hypothetical protein
MKQKVNQIRDLAIIEKTLNKSKVGILAYRDDKGKINQAVTPFVYVDKNIFLFYDKDENFDRIMFNSNVNFSVLKEEKISKENVLDFEPAYRFLQIWCDGIIKNIDDSKIKDDVIEAYLDKYNLKPEEMEKNFEILFFIDTEQLQAAEMFGS